MFSRAIGSHPNGHGASSALVIVSNSLNQKNKSQSFNEIDSMPQALTLSAAAVAGLLTIIEMEPNLKMIE